MLNVASDIDAIETVKKTRNGASDGGTSARSEGALLLPTERQLDCSGPGNDDGLGRRRRRSFGNRFTDGKRNLEATDAEPLHQLAPYSNDVDGTWRSDFDGSRFRSGFGSSSDRFANR